MTQPTTLRRRIAITASAALLIISGILIVFAEMKVSWLEERFARDQVAATTDLLQTVQNLDAGFMRRLTQDISTAEEVDQALGRNGPADSLPLRRLFAQVAETVDFRVGFIAVARDKSVVASYRRLQPEIDLGGISDILVNERQVETVAMLYRERVGLLVSSEIRRGDRVAGHVIAVIDLGNRTSQFFQSAFAIGFLKKSEDGVAVIGRDPAGLSELLGECCDGTERFKALSEDNKHLIMSTVPMRDAQGDVVADFFSIRDFTAEGRRQQLLSGLSFLAIALSILLSIGLLMRALRIAFRPLGAVVQLLQRLSEGDTEVQLKPVNAAREIDTLVQTVETFRSGLDARNRLLILNEQLAGARRIQQSLLADHFDLSPELDLFAVMKPAEEVGGDFFDVFNLPDRRIAFVIADVSGKGVAAALFAARASMVLRSNARLLSDPVAIMTSTNEELCQRNPEDLFISVFLGIIDPSTGQVVYVNAGHCPPIITENSHPAHGLDVEGQLVLGVFPGFKYEAKELMLDTDDMMLIYSDGFDESQNEEGELLGVDRAIKIVDACRDGTPKETVGAIIDHVHNFVGDAPQFDDITLLAVRRLSTPRETHAMQAPA
ncbi:MAG: PP2C family protein-serine/threonine phosphatase [Pseudomonadota bacterium]